jgi:hypothetical protein
MRIYLKVSGMKWTEQRMLAVARALRKATQSALIDVGLDIQGRAQRLTPLNTGNLRASAFTMWPSRLISVDRLPEIVEGAAGGMVAAGTGAFHTRGRKYDISEKELSRVLHSHVDALTRTKREVSEEHQPSVYVGFTTYYATYVHENLEARHDIGEAKFLEKAVFQAMPDMARKVAHYQRRAAV